MKRLQTFVLTVLAVFACVAASAQGNNVTGKVTADDGAPLGGVIVSVEGTNNYATTDVDGLYTINAQRGEVINFQLLGYTATSETVGASATINVAMAQDATLIDDLVIVGYGVQKKSVVTAAISSVGSDDLDLGQPTTVQNALKGKVSGVQITSNSGAPGADSKVLIRGVGTVNNTGPLYIVDGMPSSDGINYLNPTDIASIEILKDAASAAIYGSRGANGVILVTTKEGTVGKTTFNYEFSYGFQNPAKKSNLMNGAEYQAMMNEMGYNSDPERGANFYFPTPSSVDTDWQEELTYKNAPVVNHRFSVSGGNDRSNFYASFGIVDQSGIFAKGYADYTRYNARVNYNNTLVDAKDRNWLNKVRLGVRAAYSREEFIGSNIGNSEAGGILASMNMLAPTESVYQDNPNVLAEYERIYPNYVKDDNGRAYNIINMNEILNPLAALKVRNNQVRMPQAFNSNVDLNVDIIPGLTFRSAIGFEWQFNSDRQVTPAYTLNTNNPNVASFVNNSQAQAYQWQWENVLQYVKSFNKHNISALVGTTMLSSFNNDISGRRYDLMAVDIDKGFLNISGAADGDSRARVNGDAGDHRLASVFGRVGYNFDEKYMVELTVRRDASSNFSEKNKYAVFPSVSVGWNITNESFMDNRPEWLNFVKLRASWGQNGNENIPALRYRPLMEQGGLKAVIDDQIVQGSKPNGYYNPNLKWETSQQTDIGLDIRLFEALDITIDWFDKKTINMLSQVSIPDYTGFTTIWANKGTVSNKGWEFDARYRFTAGEFKFGVGANASWLKNVVTEQGDSDIPVSIDGLGGGLGGAVTWRANGEPYGFFYGYVHDGIFQNQAEVDAVRNEKGELLQTDAKVGGIRWKDLDGKPGITGDDRQNIGNPIPDWTFGLNLNAEWRAWDLSVFFQGVAGNQIYKLYRRNNIIAANWDKAWSGRWTGEGTSNWYPQVVEGSQNGPNTVSNFYVEDGDYLRLKVLQLGYTLPSRISEKVWISKLRVYGQAENLLTITGYSGLDPEVGTRNGFDGGTYPQPRVFSFGVNVTF